MPKKVRPEELDLIVSIISRYPEGMRIEDLLSQSDLHLTHRTLQRRLSQLVAEGHLVVEGEGRALRYIARNIIKMRATLPLLEVAGYAEPYVTVSSEGSEIKAYVRQPKQMRTPVGYNLNFLEAYHPNETFYLPENIRHQLRQLGTTPEQEKPAGTFARDILNRLLIDLSWASSHLEGNTYSRLDTERLIEHGQIAEGKDAEETQMILNHKDAIEMLINDAERVDFDRNTILNLHAFLSDGLLVDPRACGRIRERAVEIGGSVYRPIALPQRLDELFSIILEMTREISDPFEQAFFSMVHLPYLQPFEDVNKRVSRLAANIPLIRQNFCPLSFIDVPARAYIDAMLGIYELNRVELLRDVFVWAYERSCQQYVAVQRQLVPPDPFRLRYRSALSNAIKAIVVNLLPATSDAVNTVVPPTVSEKDRDRFVRMVLEEVEFLYEGNARRFGLRPLEVDAWRKEVS